MDRQLKLLTGVVMMTGLIALDAGSVLSFVRCVGPTIPTCPGSCNFSYTSIQDAVNNATPGDTVCVGDGTYAEQVTIDRSLTLQGNRVINTVPPQGLSVIKPSSVTANATDLATGEPIAAIVLVDGATAVALKDLTIDGDPAGSGFSCAPGFAGIFYSASSGSIQTTVVTNIKHPPHLGCQSALGILVQSDPTGVEPNAVVTIIDNWVDNYGKNGITANENGTLVDVERNLVAGLGDVTGVAAQNGVQIGFGASGLVKNNIILNNGSSSDSVLSCGVLFFQALLGKRPAQNNIFDGNEQDVCSATTASSLHSPSD
jgi:hypothetical protein